MKKIRVANTSYLSSTPYRDLSELDFVDYQENVPTENARKLHEGEVDLALIPTFEYAMHGSYLGLDFGIACEEKTELLTLFGKQSIENLQRIFMYPSSSSSYWLLRLLLHFKWQARPKLIKNSREMKLATLADSDGILLRRTSFQPEYEQLPFKIDLVKEWYELTQQPFVFLIWAARPGFFDQSFYSLINAEFHKMVKAFRESEFQRKMRDAHMLEDISYYLEERHLESLGFSFQLGKESGILPEIEYQNPRFPILPSSKTVRSLSKALSEIYDQVLMGQRLSVEDALCLCQRAPTADLLFLSQQLRSQECESLCLERVLTIKSPVEQYSGVRADSLVLDNSEMDLPTLEKQIMLAWQQFELPIQAISIPDLHALSKREGISVMRVLERLKSAGLSCLNAASGQLLLDRDLQNSAGGLLASEYLHMMDLAQALDIQTVASIRISLKDAWVDRLTHLEKLRQLEDRNPGIRHICLLPDSANNLAQLSQLYLRIALITQLFVDNIRLTQTLSHIEACLPIKLVAESCGGKLLLDARSEQAKSSDYEILRAFKSSTQITQSTLQSV